MNQTEPTVTSLRCVTPLPASDSGAMSKDVVDWTPRAVGTALVVSVAMIWLGSSFLVKDLERDSTVSPFVVSLVANSLLTLYIPSAYLRRRLFPQKTCLTDWQLIKSAVLMGPILWCGQFTFNTSLHFTSVSASTILSSTGAIFTFVLGLIFLKESFSCLKILSVLACCTGTVLVALSDTHKDTVNPNPVWGDCMVVLSCCLYACYSVMMTKWLPASSKPDTILFFGYVGFVQTLLFSVIGLILVSFEVISFDLDRHTFLGILVKGIFDNVLSDVLWIKAVLLLGPTAAAVGMSLQWPMALILDALFFHPPWMFSATALALVSAGCVLIFGGYVGINLPPEWMFSCHGGATEAPRDAAVALDMA